MAEMNCDDMHITSGWPLTADRYLDIGPMPAGKEYRISNVTVGGKNIRIRLTDDAIDDIVIPHMRTVVIRSNGGSYDRI
jgi:hypothetical protein